MASKHVIRENDTREAIEAQLQDATGSAIDLSSISELRFQMERRGNTVVDSVATVVDGANGKVKYDWADGDTDTAGTYQAEFRITFQDDSVLTVPNDDYITVEVTSEIN